MPKAEVSYHLQAEKLDLPHMWNLPSSKPTTFSTGKPMLNLTAKLQFRLLAVKIVIHKLFAMKDSHWLK